jgi:hypothetical protein
VQFLALDHCPSFFRDLEHHFAVLSSKLLGPPTLARDALKVKRVGAFEASFVPSVDQ